ncbi:MAG TPA: GNAT family N-acetyltransferase [Pseudomonadota bacterium]|nr:GNAT family N-acetyltransferase [Rhodanobacteraceae bacterium]MBP9153685.1 GNAT family N-acetyltransferase [Xanthomonadales bacterium]HQW81563.1 GNAT family N-acetyltransferase [Pseudomonadota bacterium]
MSHVIRQITPADNAAVAQIIRAVMPEFGADGPGFAIQDAEVDDMATAYAIPHAAYFVVECDGVVMGGGGIAPLIGGDTDTCELRKMYFLPSLRGLGTGNALMQTCIAKAREFGFDQIYLETLTGMDAAKKLYRMSGFVPLKSPLGRTGHFSCDSFFLLKL